MNWFNLTMYYPPGSILNKVSRPDHNRSSAWFAGLRAILHVGYTSETDQSFVN